MKQDPERGQRQEGYSSHARGGSSKGQTRRLNVWRLDGDSTQFACLHKRREALATADLPQGRFDHNCNHRKLHLPRIPLVLKSLNRTRSHMRPERMLTHSSEQSCRRARGWRTVFTSCWRMQLHLPPVLTPEPAPSRSFFSRSRRSINPGGGEVSFLQWRTAPQRLPFSAPLTIFTLAPSPGSAALASSLARAIGGKHDDAPNLPLLIARLDS